MVAVIDNPNFQDNELLFSNDYYYKITAINALDEESTPSIEIKSKTHEYVEVPILSSMNTKTNIALIWNEVQFAESYNVYRDGSLAYEAVDATDLHDDEDVREAGQGLMYESAYDYIVTGSNEAGESTDGHMVTYSDNTTEHFGGRQSETCLLYTSDAADE